MSPIRSAPRRGEESPSQGDRCPRRGNDPRRARRWAPRAILLAGLALLATGCQSNAFTRMGMLPPVTKQGQVTLHLWQGAWLAAWIVGIIVWFLIVYAVIFHRKRSDKLPDQVRYNLPIEVMYTVLPFIMVGVLFYFTARDENRIDALSPHPQVVVNVTGFQWSWEFQYPQYPVKGSPSMVTELGNMWNPALPSNEQHLPLLVIPTGKNVRFNLVSADVDHSFWVPEFEFKRDLIPGHPNHFQVTPTKTGTFYGHCSELCGLYHSRMLFELKIVTPAQFTAWVHAQQAHQNATGGAQ
ncbi:MAG: cytochrome c oxidase subunit II [Streptosporangiaceae bacterium]